MTGLVMIIGGLSIAALLLDNRDHKCKLRQLRESTMRMADRISRDCRIIGDLRLAVRERDVKIGRLQEVIKDTGVYRDKHGRLRSLPK